MVAKASIRRQWVKEQLQATNRWPTAQDIMKQFECTKSPAYADLEAVTKELSVEFDIERLRLQVMKRLGDRMPELSDRDLVRLGVAFLPQKVEQKSEVKVESRTGDEIVELLKQYAPIAEQIIAESRGPKPDLPKDSSGKPVDPQGA